MKNLFSPIFIILTALLLFLSSCSADSNKHKPSQESIDQVKSEIAEYKEILPISAGYNLDVVNIDFDESNYTLNYKFQFNVPDSRKPTESTKYEMKKAIVDNIQSIPSTRDLVEQGYTYHYDIYSLENDLLYSVDISLDDLDVD